MPSRIFCVAIVLFWLVGVGLLVVHEVLPRVTFEEAPPFVIELTDEFDSAKINWTVYHTKDADTEIFGRVQSQVRRVRDGSREGEFLLVNDWRTPFRAGKLEINDLHIGYRVTKKGDLLGFFIRGTTDKFSLKLAGDFEDGQLKLLFNEQPLNLPTNELPAQPNVLNSMLLLHKLPPIREGQTWSIQHFDPLSLMPGMKTASLPQLTARVGTESLIWHQDEVPAFKIDYRDFRGELHAGTWVRKKDFVVLKQWFTYQGQQLTSIRDPK